MTKPAKFTQATIARAIRAAKQAGADAVEVLPDRVRIVLDGEEHPETQGAEKLCDEIFGRASN